MDGLLHTGQVGEVRGSNAGLSFAGQTTWPSAGPSLLGGQGTRCHLLKGMGWAGSGPGTMGILQFLLFRVFLTLEEHEAQRSQRTWQEARPELSRPSGNLDLVVSRWSENPTTAPYYLRVMLGVSQTGGPACSPPRERGVGGTGSHRFFPGKRGETQPAGLVGA